MWMIFEMVTVASVFALGFPQLTKHVIGPRLRLSIEQTLISLGLVEHQAKKLKATRQ